MKKMSSEKKYPVSEIFTSPQGEGLYTGAMMTFVRLAGCSVGKKMTEEERDRFRLQGVAGTELNMSTGLDLYKPLPVYTEKCTTWDGREFACDTDFRTKEVLTAGEIIKRVPEGVDRICITGGEPLNHDLTDLLGLAYQLMLDVHIETSGTVPIKKGYPKFEWSDLMGESVRGWIWLTVSPKFEVLDAMLECASEIKFLVDENFDPEKIPAACKQRSLIYIQPINFENEVNDENMQRCLALQKKFPHWRLSSQAHKIWSVR
jgi:organic radical activating enzyme